VNRRTVIRVILWQYALVFIGALSVGIIFGFNAAFSCIAGGACVAVPNTLVALSLLRSLSKGGSSPASLLLFEFLKMAIACVLLLLVAMFYSGLNWPAMLLGLAVAALSSLALLIGK
jgi:ATP synthase protein I